MTVQKTPKDPSVAMILEITLGLGGMPGMGWIYADRVDAGLKLLIGYWLFLVTLLGGYMVLTVATFGFGMILGICIIPIFLAVHLGLIFISATRVNDYLKFHNMSTSASLASYNPQADTNLYAPPGLRTAQERKDWVQEPRLPQPKHSPPIKQGFSGGQVFVIVILSIIAFVIFSCVALAIIGATVGSPPG